MDHYDSPKVDFNLDTFTNAGDLAPYVVIADGRPWSFQHVDKCDGWQVADAFAGNGEDGADIEVVKAALGDQFEEFRKATKGKIDHGGFKALVKKYLEHCGLDTGN